jgi:hypothetical protein
LNNFVLFDRVHLAIIGKRVALVEKDLLHAGPALTCETRPRKDHRGVDLISNVLPFGRLWYEQAPDAISRPRSPFLLGFVTDQKPPKFWAILFSIWSRRLR